METAWSPVPRNRVVIGGGFWKKWRELIGNVTLFHQLEEMRGEGHIDALELDQKMHRGRSVSDDWYWGASIFWDSDLAKWLEAAAAYLEQAKDDRLEHAMDDIIARFERKGLAIAALRHMTVSRELAERHYAEHAERPFFGELVDCVSAGGPFGCMMDSSGGPPPPPPPAANAGIVTGVVTSAATNIVRATSLGADIFMLPSCLCVGLPVSRQC